jgi:hypothetical protein
VSLSVYLDASGHPADSDFMVVSGFIATADQWILWKQEWDQALHAEGIQVFHATDCNAHKKEFAGWDDKRTSWFLRRLASIVQQYCKFSISSIIYLDDYRELNKKYDLDRFFPPYALAARTSLALINRWKKDFGEDNVEVFFERGDLDYGKFMNLMRLEGLPDPIFRDRKQVVALQSADLFAWEQNFELRRMQSDYRLKHEAVRQVIQMLLEVPFECGKESYHGEYRRADLERMVSDARIPTRPAVA